MSKKGDVVGGPGIPFPKQTFLEKICYYSKRSYFVTGYLNFRKYKAKQKGNAIVFKGNKKQNAKGMLRIFQAMQSKMRCLKIKEEW